MVSKVRRDQTESKEITNHRVVSPKPWPQSPFHSPQSKPIDVSIRTPDMQMTWERARTKLTNPPLSQTASAPTTHMSTFPMMYATAESSITIDSIEASVRIACVFSPSPNWARHKVSGGSSRRERQATHRPRFCHVDLEPLLLPCSMQQSLHDHATVTMHKQHLSSPSPFCISSVDLLLLPANITHTSILDKVCHVNRNDLPTPPTASHELPRAFDKLLLKLSEAHLGRWSLQRQEP